MAASAQVVTNQKCLSKQLLAERLLQIEMKSHFGALAKIFKRAGLQQIDSVFLVLQKSY